MANPFAKLDWSLVQAFVAVADSGSLSAAAKSLNLTQPTVGRQISAMEDALGLELFQRRPKGMEITDIGLSLLPAAQSMSAAANELQMSAAGSKESPGGTVRITSSVFMGHYVLPGILAGIRREHPEIALELVPSDTSENLLFREADIAVRLYRPTQLDVVTRLIGALELGLFASKAYLDRIGRPVDILDVDVVGYDRNDLIVQGFRTAGIEVTRDSFPVRCDLQSTYWELVRAGCGAGFCQRGIALKDPTVEEIPMDFRIPPLEVWLTAPEAIRLNPTVSKVWSALAEALAKVVDHRP